MFNIDSPWYNKLRPVKKLAVQFLFYICGWFLFEILMRFIDEARRSRSVSKILLTIFILSFFSVLIFQWKLVKRVFTKNLPGNSSES